MTEKQIRQEKIVDKTEQIFYINRRIFIFASQAFKPDLLLEAENSYIFNHFLIVPNQSRYHLHFFSAPVTIYRLVTENLIVTCRPEFQRLYA